MEGGNGANRSLYPNDLSLTFSGSVPFPFQQGTNEEEKPMNESLTRVILSCTEQTRDVGNEDGAPRANEDLPLGAPPDAKGRTDEENGERERGVERNGGEGRRKRARNTHSLIWAALKDRQAPAPLFILCDPLGSSGWETLEVGSC